MVWTLATIRTDCKVNLGSPFYPLHGGDAEVFDLTYRKQLSLNNLRRHRKSWDDLGVKFSHYARQCEAEVLRDVVGHHRFYLSYGDQNYRIDTAEELEKALAAGWTFNVKANPQMNPCAELLNDRFALVGENRVHRSGNPYPMSINKAQLRHIARALWLWLIPAGSASPVIRSLAHIKLSKSLRNRLLIDGMSAQTTELIYSYYNQTRQPQWWGQFNQYRLYLRGKENLAIYVERVAKLLYDAWCVAGTIPNSWKTSTVMDLVNIMRVNEEFQVYMPILADALQDAGCDNSALLDHYRDPESRFSLGSWIFRATGTL